MSIITEPDAVRVSKREFQARFARRAGVSLPMAKKVYDAMIEELVELVGRGHRVTLTGFGKFYMQEHKGHSVQFSRDKRVDDYAVLRFSSTTELNKRIKETYTAANGDGDDDGDQ